MPALTNPSGGPPRLVRRWLLPLEDNVIALSWSPDGSAVAAATVAGPITVVEAATGRPRWSGPGHPPGTADLSWNFDGTLLVTVGLDGNGRLWSGDGGEARGVVDAGAAWAEHVLCHPKRDLFVTAAGRKVRLWTSSGGLFATLPDHAATVSDLAWRPGSHDLSTATHGMVGLWSVPNEAEADQPLTPLKELTRQGPILKLAWSPDGRRLAHGNQDCSISYWILTPPDELLMSGYPGKVNQLVWDRSGTYLASNGADVVTVWNTTPPGPADTEPLSFSGHSEHVTALAYQSSGPLLASGAGDGLVLLHQPGKFKKSVARTDTGAPVSTLAWAPADRALAVGTEAGLAVYFLA